MSAPDITVRIQTVGAETAATQIQTVRNSLQGVATGGAGTERAISRINFGLASMLQSGEVGARGLRGVEMGLMSMLPAAGWWLVAGAAVIEVFHLLQKSTEDSAEAWKKHLDALSVQGPVETASQKMEHLRDDIARLQGELAKLPTGPQEADVMGAGLERRRKLTQQLNEAQDKLYADAVAGIDTDQDAVNKYVAKLREEAETVGMNKEQLVAYQLQQRNATSQEITQAQAYQHTIDVFAAQKKAQEEAAAAEKRRREEIASTIKKLEEDVAVVGMSTAAREAHRLVTLHASTSERDYARFLVETTAALTRQADAQKKLNETFSAWNQLQREGIAGGLAAARARQGEESYFGPINEQLNQDFDQSPAGKWYKDFQKEQKDLRKEALETGQFVAEAYGAGLDALMQQGATAGKVVAAILGALGREFSVKAMGELAEGIAASFMPPPLDAAAAGHFKAAALFTAAALAAGVGAASMGGGGGGGGGAGYTPGSYGALAQQGIGHGGEATIYIEGGILDMSDPRQSDALARAIQQLSGLNRITIVSH